MFNAQEQTQTRISRNGAVASQLIEEVTAHEHGDSLEDAREICADGTYFPNNLRTSVIHRKHLRYTTVISTIRLL